MTIREKICEAGVNTLREYMCVNISSSGIPMLVPYTDVVLDIQKNQLSINKKNSILSLEIQSKEINVIIPNRYLSIDIQNLNKEIDNGCS